MDILEGPEDKDRHQDDHRSHDDPGWDTEPAFSLHIVISHRHCLKQKRDQTPNSAPLSLFCLKYLEILGNKHASAKYREILNCVLFIHMDTLRLQELDTYYPSFSGLGQANKLRCHLILEESCKIKRLLPALRIGTSLAQYKSQRKNPRKENLR